MSPQDLPPDRIKVWDGFVRLNHWLTLTLVLINWLILDEGDIHEWLGYVVAALLGLRLIWGFVGSETARFRSFWPSRTKIRTHLKARGKRARTRGHNPVGALMIFNLFLALLAVSVTGHLMTTDRFWGTQIAEDLHVLSINYLLVSALIHVVGVVFESLRSRSNLIGAMITGWKRVDMQDRRETP